MHACTQTCKAEHEAIAQPARLAKVEQRLVKRLWAFERRANNVLELGLVAVVALLLFELQQTLVDYLEQHQLLLARARLQALVHHTLVHRFVEKRVDVVEPEARWQGSERSRRHSCRRLAHHHLHHTRHVAPRLLLCNLRRRHRPLIVLITLDHWLCGRHAQLHPCAPGRLRAAQQGTAGRQWSPNRTLQANATMALQRRTYCAGSSSKARAWHGQNRGHSECDRRRAGQPHAAPISHCSRLLIVCPASETQTAVYRASSISLRSSAAEDGFGVCRRCAG